MVRVVAELCAAARRVGLTISPAEVIDAVRALSLAGVHNKTDVALVLTNTLVKRVEDQARFLRVFERFFEARGGNHQDLYERLAALGFQPEELVLLRELLRAHAAVREDPVWNALQNGQFAAAYWLDVQAQRIDVSKTVDASRVGFVTMRFLDALGVPRADVTFERLSKQLRDQLGERGQRLSEVLGEELASFRKLARARVVEAAERAHEAHDQDLAHVPFALLDARQDAEIEREIVRVAERLRGRSLVRRKHQRKGRIHVMRTLRRARQTGQVPFVPVRRKKRDRRERWVVLCDVSDSVQHASRFLLSLVISVQKVFDSCRSFVFVSDVGEATQLFRHENKAKAIALAQGGAVISVADNSHYARALNTFSKRFADAVDARTTLVIIGDARTNHFDAGESALEKLANKAARTVWLNPEPESSWRALDSAMSRYLPLVDEAYSVRDLATLRIAARAIVGR